MGYDLRKLRFFLFLNWSLFDIMIESRKFKLTNDFISIIFRMQWIPEKLSTFYWWGFNQTKQCEENVFDSWTIEIHFIPTNKTRVYFMIFFLQFRFQMKYGRFIWRLGVTMPTDEMRANNLQWPSNSVGWTRNNNLSWMFAYRCEMSSKKWMKNRYSNI